MTEGEVVAVEDLHLGHGLLGVRPVHDDVIFPGLHAASPQASLGETGGHVGLVLEEAEPAVHPIVSVEE